MNREFLTIGFHPQRVRHRIDEPVCVEIRIVNDGDRPRNVCREAMEFHHMINGQEQDACQHSWATPPYELVSPGSSLVVLHPHQLDFGSLYRGNAVIETFEFQMAATLLVDGQSLPATSEPFWLEVDFRQTSPLPTPDGTRSHYIRDGERVLYVSSNSRAYEGRAKVLRVDGRTARVLNEQYLVDDASVFRDGRQQRKVNARRFRVLNRIFAGDDRMILTTYGDAKVADPGSFEVLDDGTNTQSFSATRGGYRGGFARDRHYLYFFDESTSGAHAIRVRGCKSPETFVSLSDGYGRDEGNVFLESSCLKGADPSSWSSLNPLFSCDRSAVFYLNQRIEDADPGSFEVLEAPDGQGKARSPWGKDGTHYYEGSSQRSEADYLRSRR